MVFTQILKEHIKRGNTHAYCTKKGGIYTSINENQSQFINIFFIRQYRFDHLAHVITYVNHIGYKSIQPNPMFAQNTIIW